MMASEQTDTHDSIYARLVPHTEKVGDLHVTGKTPRPIQRICTGPGTKCLFTIKEYQLQAVVCELVEGRREEERYGDERKRLEEGKTKNQEVEKERARKDEEKEAIQKMFGMCDGVCKSNTEYVEREQRYFEAGMLLYSTLPWIHYGLYTQYHLPRLSSIVKDWRLERSCCKCVYMNVSRS